MTVYDYDTDSTLSDLDDDLYYQQDPVVPVPKQDMTWITQYLASNYKNFGWETVDDYELANNFFDEEGFKRLSQLAKIIMLVTNDMLMIGDDILFTPLDIEASGVNVHELFTFLESEIQHHVRFLTGNEILKRDEKEVKYERARLIGDIDKLSAFLIALKLHFGEPYVKEPQCGDVDMFDLFDFL